MVEERLEDGGRIARLLASEIDSREDGELSRLAVVDAEPDAKATDEGAFAYGIEADGERLAELYLQPDRVRLEFGADHEAIVDAARGEELRVRPKAVVPPRTLVFVESGGEVKRVVSAIERALQAN